MVGFRQVGTEQQEGAELELAISDLLEDDRKLTSELGGAGATERGVF